MIIYLEGVDGTGKSTLVRMLEDSLSEFGKVDAKANERIPTYPTRPNRVNQTKLFKELKAMARDNVIHIIDRGPISDIIYRVFDDYDPVTTLDKVEEFIKLYNNRILTIYCRNSNAKRNMLERGDDNPIAIAKHDELSKSFDIVMNILFNNLSCNCAIYDFNDRNSIGEVLGHANYFVYMGLGVNGLCN